MASVTQTTGISQLDMTPVGNMEVPPAPGTPSAPAVSAPAIPSPAMGSGSTPSLPVPPMGMPGGSTDGGAMPAPGSFSTTIGHAVSDEASAIPVFGATIKKSGYSLSDNLAKNEKLLAPTANIAVDAGTAVAALAMSVGNELIAGGTYGAGRAAIVQDALEANGEAFQTQFAKPETLTVPAGAVGTSMGNLVDVTGANLLGSSETLGATLVSLGDGKFVTEDESIKIYGSEFGDNAALVSTVATNIGDTLTTAGLTLSSKFAVSDGQKVSDAVSGGLRSVIDKSLSGNIAGKDGVLGNVSAGVVGVATIAADNIENGFTAGAAAVDFSFNETADDLKSGLGSEGVTGSLASLAGQAPSNGAQQFANGIGEVVEGINFATTFPAAISQQFETSLIAGANAGNTVGGAIADGLAIPSNVGDKGGDADTLVEAYAEISDQTFNDNLRNIGDYLIYNNGSNEGSFPIGDDKGVAQNVLETFAAAPAPMAEMVTGPAGEFGQMGLTQGSVASGLVTTGINTGADTFVEMAVTPGQEAISGGLSTVAQSVPVFGIRNFAEQFGAGADTVQGAFAGDDNNASAPSSPLDSLTGALSGSANGDFADMFGDVPGAGGFGNGAPQFEAPFEAATVTSAIGTAFEEGSARFGSFPNQMAA